MKLLFFSLLVLSGAVGLALLAQDDPGYVLFAWRDWTVESTLALLLVGLALGFGLLYLAIRLLVGLLNSPGRMARWRRKRRAARVRRSTQRGLIALAEGNWRTAERRLIRYAEDSEIPIINYLGAARAAQKLNADGRRDEYLSRAHKSMPEAELAVGLTQAEVQLSHGQSEHALATLMHLRSVAPRHGFVLHLLRRVYERLGSWKELLELLPELRRQKVISPADADALEFRAHSELLARAADNLDELRTRWEQVPKPLRRDVLLERYVTTLIARGAHEDAERLLRERVRQEWNPALVRLYGLTQDGNPEKQLAVAEAWLADHDRQPDLLLTLGRLCLRAQLWGKARAYLEASIGAEPRPETYCELGHLLIRLGDEDQARDCFRNGLELATGNSGSACTAFANGRLPARAG